jgi:hypothetical protein
MERLYTEQYTSYKPCLSYILTIVKWPVIEAEIILLSPYKNSFVELFSDSNLQSLLKDTFINSEINYLCGQTATVLQLDTSLQVIVYFSQ